MTTRTCAKPGCELPVNPDLRGGRGYCSRRHRDIHASRLAFATGHCIQCRRRTTDGPAVPYCSDRCETARVRDIKKAIKELVADDFAKDLAGLSEQVNRAEMLLALWRGRSDWDGLRQKWFRTASLDRVAPPELRQPPDGFRLSELADRLARLRIKSNEVRAALKKEEQRAEARRVAERERRRQIEAEKAANAWKAAVKKVLR